MKNIKIYVSVLAVLLSLAMIHSCKEVGPVLPWGGSHVLSDTTYTETPPAAQPKNVLLEAFTGVQCVNCPPGDALLDTMMASSYSSGGHVIGVAMHSKFLDDPLPYSRQTLTSDKAEQLVTPPILGSLPSKPCGAVDRILHAVTDFSPNAILDGIDKWSGYVASEFATPLTPVNLTFAAHTYNPATKVLALTLKTEYVSTQSDSDKISIFLTEDSIVTAQLFPTSVDTFFVHNHVFRDALTNIQGDAINCPPVAGTANVKTYSYTISNTVWNPAHMYVVAFIHEYQSRWNVLQTQIIKLQ